MWCASSLFVRALRGGWLYSMSLLSGHHADCLPPARFGHGVANATRFKSLRAQSHNGNAMLHLLVCGMGGLALRVSPTETRLKIAAGSSDWSYTSYHNTMQLEALPHAEGEGEKHSPHMRSLEIQQKPCENIMSENPPRLVWNLKNVRRQT